MSLNNGDVQQGWCPWTRERLEDERVKLEAGRSSARGVGDEPHGAMDAEGLLLMTDVNNSPHLGEAVEPSSTEKAALSSTPKDQTWALRLVLCDPKWVI